MAGGLSSLRLVVALVLTTGACATADTPRPTGTPQTSAALEPSHEFQRGYDQALRDDPTSFLTTVAAHYLAPGDSLALVASDAGPELALQASVEALTIGDGDAQRRFEDHGELAIDDRFTLDVSRQEDDWRVLVHDRESKRRAEFSGVTWFPVDARFIVEARYEPRAAREPMLLQTSRGVQKTLYVAGEASFELAGSAARLLVFAYAAEPSLEEPMLIPFRDETSGKSSYAAGRYLEIVGPADNVVILDFNRATNPLCAYSEYYNCPMPPRFNTLTAAIEAGAMSPH